MKEKRIENREYKGSLLSQSILKSNEVKNTSKDYDVFSLKVVSVTVLSGLISALGFSSFMTLIFDVLNLLKISIELPIFTETSVFIVMMILFNSRSLSYIRFLENEQGLRWYHFLLRENFVSIHIIVMTILYKSFTTL